MPHNLFNFDIINKYYIIYIKHRLEKSDTHGREKRNAIAAFNRYYLDKLW